MENGLLKTECESGDVKHVTIQLVVTREYVPWVLEELHEETSGTHLGDTYKGQATSLLGHCREDVKKWSIKCTIFTATKGPTTPLNISTAHITTR